jgi:hypothetical protein
MNVEEIFQQVINENCKDPLHRFAELVSEQTHINNKAKWYQDGYEAGQRDEREACAKFVEHEYMRQFEEPWRKNLAAAIRGRTD